jgi:predicted membrane channel-forming protein YqfA (hemolysin III family)
MACFILSSSSWNRPQHSLRWSRGWSMFSFSCIRVLAVGGIMLFVVKGSNCKKI